MTMEGEDWDIESYRNKFEPDEQWELRKKFMETHKNLFSEERVVCLAQVLVNVEFLGTKYPAETMRTVAELSLGFINEFRERGKTRLQRTFVGGSDAAQAKVKGRINFVKASNTLGNDEKEGNSPSVSIPSKKLKEMTTDALPDSSLEQSESTIKKKKKKKKNKEEAVDLAVVDDTNKVSIKEKKKKKEEVPDESSKTASSNKKKKKKLENKVEEGESPVDPPPEQMVSKKKRKCQSADSAEPSDVKKLKVSAQTATCEIGEAAESLVCKTSKRKKAAATPESASSSSTHYSNTSKVPRFVLVLREGDDEKPGKLRTILSDSARLSRMSFDIKSQCVDEGEWESVVLFDGSLFMAGYSTTMKESQMDAVKKSFTELKRTNFQLIITEKDVNSIQEFLINEDENAAASQTNTKISTITKDALTEAESKPPVGDDGDGKVKSSFAMKMMKKMGWAGAGLGAQEQGITAPIEADVVVGRNGLGFDGHGSAGPNFEKSMKDYLKAYLASSAANKLIFSNQFSSEERAVIHGIARKIGLHSKSSGKDENRQLTVRRAPPQPRPLIEWVHQLKRTPHSKIQLLDPTE